ncbi:MAG: GDP-mannose 4,6-dehydratase [Candidatus Sumerlaeia bacterium]
MAEIAVTGACGFVGSNLVYRLLKTGRDVVLIDNLSRRGAEKNLAWLRSMFPGLNFHRVDVRDSQALAPLLASCRVIYHLASQVAVTTSVENPREDFEVNALGTLNVLEAARLGGRFPVVIFPSTNKVYGGLEDLEIRERRTRYEFTHLPEGVDEARPLDFHSPYGCSKGAADQYVRDYCRIYRIPTVVFRMSCQFGPRQFGNEDQGWVAHFLIRALRDQPLTIYGDGRQVRDILYIDDLVDLFLLAAERADITQGHIYNVGGGRENSISLLELLDFIREELGRRPRVTFGAWRPGDQRIYISNCGRLAEHLGWKPRVPMREGLERLARWIEANPELFD